MSRAALDRSSSRCEAARRAAPALLALGASVLTACHGPSLRVDGGDRVYRDGARIEPGQAMPFRYYGTTVLDAVPEGANGGPDFARTSRRTEVEIEEPASPWLFPVDFVLELAQRPFAAPEEQRVEVAPAVAPTQVSPGFQPEGLEPLRTRAFAARSAR